MEIAIISAAATIVSGIIAVISCVITANRRSAEIDAKLDKQQAVFETRLDELTREVRIYNEIAVRLPVMEEQIKNISFRVTNVEHQLKGVNA